MIIRPAQSTDSPEVVRVIKAVYDEFGFLWDAEGYHADLYDIQTHYLDHGTPFWVAEVDGVVMGTVGLELFPAIPGEPGTVSVVDGVRRVAGTQCGLERLYVHANARMVGVGTALMQITLAEAARRGCTGMEIWSDKEFEESHKLYRRIGAHTVGDRLCHDPNQSPEWGMFLAVGVDQGPSPCRVV